MKKLNSKYNKLQFKSLALLLILLVPIFYQCKSTLDEDLNSLQKDEELLTEAETLSATNSKSNVTLKSGLPFPIGAAVKFHRLKTKVYSDVIIKEFNSVTAESEMKFKSLHPSKDVYTWTEADDIVSFAVKNKMRVHGHTLIWAKDDTYPKWLLNYKGDKNAWDKLLKAHVQTVVKHFKGKVASWDVVNEAVESNGKFADNIWLRKLGVDYIYKAFVYAYEADSKAVLFYNDYGQEYGGKKMATILEMVKVFKKNKIPMHGLGFQMHTNDRMSEKEIQENITLAANTGLQLHLSELEVSLKYKKPKSWTLSPAFAAVQANKYKAIFKFYKSIPKKQQFGITTWGVGDADSFRNSDYDNHDHPLLFDTKYQPKPAYKAVLEAVR